MSRPNAAGGRGPTHLYMGLSLLMLLAFALLVVTAPRPSVPTIAEIAPQATQQITEAPPEQWSEFGSGDGGPAGAGGEGDGGNVEEGNVRQEEDSDIEVGRVLRCVGDPPRQIEDPQSPPCIPYWPPDADNGGDTSRGIRDGIIRIAMPGYNQFGSPPLEAFFNSRFQFYGRKLQLIDTSEDRRLDDPVQNQIAAAANAEALEVFASTDYWYHGGVIYNRELARRNIIGVSYQSIFGQAELQRLRPYVWQYPMATEMQLAMLGEWVCKRLPATQAEFAGPLLSGQARTLGIVSFEDWGTSVDTTPLRNELRGCGRTIAAEYTVQAGDQDDSSTYVSTVLGLKDAGVTTIVCVCDSEPMGTLMRHASAQSYVPEWTVPTFTENEMVWMKRTYPREQAERLFGLHFLPMHRLATDDAWVWAASETNPAFGWDRGGNESSYSRQAFFHPLYRSMLLIASGIQMAGPNLTPETFEQGLQRTTFPNPPHPIMAGRVGFGGSTHSMTKDATEWWWTPSVVGPYGAGGFQGQGSGTFCFLDRGRRHLAGSFPTTRAPLFEGPCVSGDQPAGGE